MEYTVIGTKGKTALVSSKEEGLEAMKEFCASKPSGISHSLLMKEDDGYHIYNRINQPCYGELRPYRSNCEPWDIEQAKVTKPGDLHDPFPKGEPVALAVPDYSGYGWEDPLFPEEGMKFLISDRSPWHEAMQDCSRIENGLLWSETDFKPTIVLNLLILLRHLRSTHTWSILREKFPDVDELLIAALCSKFCIYDAYGKTFGFTIAQNSYSLANSLSLSAFLHGKTYDLDEGRTFRERKAYNRPQLGALFGYRYDMSRYTKVLNNKSTVYGQKEPTLVEPFIEALTEELDCPVPTDICSSGELPKHITY